MKFETFVKLGAVGVAAVTTAAGSLLITAKAVKKLGDDTFPDDPAKKGLDLTHVPALDKLLSGGLKVSESLKTAGTNDEEPIFKSDFKYEVKPDAPEKTHVAVPVAAPVPVPQPAEQPVAPAPMPFVSAPAPTPVPVAAPIPEPVPVAAQVPVALPISEPIPVPVPEMPVVVPIPEPIPVPPPVEEKYTDVPMDLPYLAGKLAKDESDCADVVITPVDKKNAEAPIEEAPAVVEEAPAVVETPAPEAPLVETSAEPIADMANSAPELPQEAPEVVLPSAEPIDEHSHLEPILTADKPADSQTFADINPLAQGFSVSMSDAVTDALPLAADASPTFADLAPIQDAPAPTTFNDLNSEYVEEVSPVVEVSASSFAAPEPVLEEAAPVVPVAEASVAPVVAQPESAAEAEPEIVTVAVPETAVPKGKTTQIGGAVVSDETSNPAISAVAQGFNVPHQNLVSISAEGNAPMVFEFLYSDMRNDASLLNVYFILPDGKATLPPETDRENVLAFGRNFITGNEELKAFLL